MSIDNFIMTNELRFCMVKEILNLTSAKGNFSYSFVNRHLIFVIYKLEKAPPNKLREAKIPFALITYYLVLKNSSTLSLWIITSL